MNEMKYGKELQNERAHSFRIMTENVVLAITGRHICINCLTKGPPLGIKGLGP